jgi:hypothetical protein
MIEEAIGRVSEEGEVPGTLSLARSSAMIFLDA